SSLPRPPAAYVPYSTSARVLHLSGHLAYRDGQPWVGKLGQTLDVAEGAEAARLIGIQLISTLDEATRAAGLSLDAIEGINKIVVLVNSTPDFTEPHRVANGCSDLLNAVFEERGRHARSAFSVTQLPLGVCVEIELIATLAQDPRSHA
ncbi:MAG TPA: RidA family protein, partial [Pseudomonas sp.]|nr:RidA family protein [Pseudomonas sp.]